MGGVGIVHVSKMIDWEAHRPRGCRGILELRARAGDRCRWSLSRWSSGLEPGSGLQWASSGAEGEERPLRLSEIQFRQLWRTPR